MVVAKKRSGCFKSGFPACAAERAVIWCTIASGRAAATASPTDTASRPSITAPSAPSRASKPSLPGRVAVAVTWWPRATSCGTSRRPKAPLPPATNTRTTITFLISGIHSQPRDEAAPAVCDIRSEDSWEKIVGGLLPDALTVSRTGELTPSAPDRKNRARSVRDTQA
jgi:hypothetical protein